MVIRCISRVCVCVCHSRDHLATHVVQNTCTTVVSGSTNTSYWYNCVRLVGAGLSKTIVGQEVAEVNKKLLVRSERGLTIGNRLVVREG